MNSIFTSKDRAEIGHSLILLVSDTWVCYRHLDRDLRLMALTHSYTQHIVCLTSGLCAGQSGSKDNHTLFFLENFEEGYELHTVKHLV